jgi:ribonuclease G
MGDILVVNAAPHETRVALIENSTISELFYERKRERGVVGNIYKGKVVRVLPGMNAAFVDIGLEKAAFLYVTDVFGGGEDFEFFLGEDDEEGNSEEDAEEEGEEGGENDEIPHHRKRRGEEPRKNIDELLHENQEILVQVAKAPIGSKGARVTCHISLPGRHLVLMPTVDHIGVSRRIANDKERKRLRDLVNEFKPKGSGFIIRTVAENKPKFDLKADMDFLLHIWNEVGKKRDQVKAPACLYEDLDIITRCARDLFGSSVEKLVIDNENEYKRLHAHISASMPQYIDRLDLYRGDEPIFDAYGIDIEIANALNRKVSLKSGGYIIIDQCEALTAIDVNTGRFVGKRNLEDTITKTNMEAVKEIVYQLRLRNIGGIIIIDFIDMDKESNREKVYHALQEVLKTDKAKTNVLKISELGLVQMTRKRVRESLGRTLTEPCHYCDGRGYLRSARSVAYDIFQEISREAPNIKGDQVIVSAHPEVAQALLEEPNATTELEKYFGKRIIVKSRPTFHQEQFDISGRIP